MKICCSSKREPKADCKCGLFDWVSSDAKRPRSFAFWEIGLHIYIYTRFTAMVTCET
jgi:hypothetical protein